MKVSPLLLVAVCTALALSAAQLAGQDCDPIEPVATPSSSYVSGDTTLAALNDGFDPRNSQDRSRRSYGNWPRRGTQWVQYDWAQPISTNRIEVYWWNDHRGVRIPKACRLLYWDGKGFVAVPNAKGLGVEESRYNTTTFDEVRTAKLRLEIDSNGNFSTGLLEWKVCDSGKSPNFPPQVRAGVDRVVVLGGKTYLDGAIKVLKREDGNQTTTTWRRASGPGSVSFADANAVKTTATFSAAGDYVVELTARVGELSSSSGLRVRVVSPPPTDHLDPIDTVAYSIDSPLWNHRVKAIIANWIPHCIERISDPNLREGGINNFIDTAAKLAGKPHKGHRGYVFSNAWVYNTIESICVALMVDAGGDEEIAASQKKMRATLDDWIPKILAAQEPDGYIQTAFTLTDRERWTPGHRHAHEGYVAGYLLEAAIAHYLVTDKKDARLYDAAKRLADCWDRHIGPPPKKRWYDGHQAMEIALVRFGRFVNTVEGGGRGDRYIALSKFLLDCRDGGHEYDQSHAPAVQQYEAVGHAVRASYSYAGMADVAMETGDIDYQSAVASLWDNIVNRKYYVTGGIGSGETSEGFGPDYSLRHGAYCESCSSCGQIYFQQKLNLATHEAKYADLLEETLYNALLGSLDLAGKNFYYQNPLATGRMRYPWHGCPCCIGNIPRVLLMLPTWTYAKGPDGIRVNLYVGSKMTIPGVAGTDVEIAQDTDYPWSGSVSITVNPAVERKFDIALRVPDRSVSEIYASTPDANGVARVAVNGATVTPRVENGYAVISRTWKTGDRVELTLPMRIQRVRAIDKVAATRGQVALRYGPLVYAVESVDQDIGGRLDPSAELTTEWRGALLGGVLVIRGKWADGSPFTAIPYYARANRADARSSVWISER